MLDAHCHLNSTRLEAEPESLLAEARAAGVTGIVMAGVDSTCWSTQLDLVKRFPTHVFPVFGLHPQVIPSLNDAEIRSELSTLRDLIARHRPVALGETGLDALSPETRSCLDVQKSVFRQQLAIARETELPVVLHLLRAEAHALAILKADGVPKRGGVVHSFSGSADFALALVRLGLHVSFCGTLTLPQSRRLREAAVAVPLERILIETDSPDQTPWAAGQAPDGSRLTHTPPNRPAWLPEIAAALADARGLTVESVAEATEANTRALFGLPREEAL